MRTCAEAHQLGGGVGAVVAVRAPDVAAPVRPGQPPRECAQGHHLPPKSYAQRLHALDGWTTCKLFSLSACLKIQLCWERSAACAPVCASAAYALPLLVCIRRAPSAEHMQSSPPRCLICVQHSWSCHPHLLRWGALGGSGTSHSDGGSLAVARGQNAPRGQGIMLQGAHGTCQQSITTGSAASCSMRTTKRTKLQERLNLLSPGELGRAEVARAAGVRV